MKTFKPEAAARQLKKVSHLRPKFAMILGSGFESVVRDLEIDGQLPYGQVAGFPPVGVSGHAGQLVVGILGGTPLMVLSGRAHFYEGHAISFITFPVRALAAYGITDLLLTNAAGAINQQFRPGDFMLLADHINFMGVNPLRGPIIPRQPHFVDLTATYDKGLASLIRRAARQSGLRLRSGVYLAVAGPNYETPAEIRAFRRLGADAVGMSTVPEAIVARQCGVRVAGLSCIANMAADIQQPPISHAQVLEAVQRGGILAAQMLKKLAKLYGQKD